MYEADDSVTGSVSWDADRVPHLWAGLRREIRRRGVREDIADDVTQEAWLRTLRRPPRDLGGLRAWLRVVGLRVLQEVQTRNRWRVEWEKRAARTDTVVCEEPSSDTRIFRLVRELPEPYQRVLWLRYHEDLDVPDIAKLNGVKESTVRSQIKRGLDRLRERAGDEREHTPWGGFALFLPGLARVFERLRASPARARSSVPIGLGLALFAAVCVWPRSDGRGSVLAPRSGASESAARAPIEESQRTELRAESARPRPSGFAAESRTADRRTGHVRQPDGTPVAGSQVWASRARGGKAIPVARTDAEGTYQVDSVALGDFLFATHPDWASSRPANFAAGRGVADLFLRPSVGRLELTVSQAGLPIVGAQVELWWSFDRTAVATCSEQGNIEVVDERSLGETDAQGRVLFARPISGDARLYVSAPGRVHHVELLVLPAGDASREIDLTSQAQIDGAVVDAAGRASPGARIEWVDGREDKPFVLEADESGRFTLPLDPGPFVLRATERAEGRAHHGQVTGELLPYEHRTLVIALDDANTIHGLALGAGSPLVNVPVDCSDAIAQEAWRTRVFTDAEGRFVFQGLSAETAYTIQLVGRGEELLEELHAVRCGGREVLLATDRPPVPDRLFELGFVAADPSLIPTVVESRGASASHVSVGSVDPSGHCAFLLPEGEHSTALVTAWVPGIGPFLVELSAEPGVQRVVVPTPGRVQFVAGPAPEVPPQSVHGGILLMNFGASWLMELRGRKTYRELTLDPGPPTEVLLFPGAYPYYFEGPGLAHCAGVVRVEPGETRVEPIELEPGIPCTIQVPYSEGAAPTLALHTPERWVELHGVPLQLDAGAARFRVSLSPRASTLEAFYLGQCGSVDLSQALLGASDPLLEIQLGTCSRTLQELRRDARGEDARKGGPPRPKFIRR